MCLKYMCRRNDIFEIRWEMYEVTHWLSDMVWEYIGDPTEPVSDTDILHAGTHHVHKQR